MTGGTENVGLEEEGLLNVENKRGFSLLFFQLARIVVFLFSCTSRISFSLTFLPSVTDEL